MYVYVYIYDICIQWHYYWVYHINMFSHVNDQRVHQFRERFGTVRCIVGVMRVRDFSTATEVLFFGSLGRLLGWFLNQQLGDSGGIIWILYVFWGIGVILMDFGEL